MAEDAHSMHGAATHEGTAAPGEVHVETVFPPFDTTHFTSQLVWLAILFGSLYLLMSKIALPRVANILEDRAEKIASSLAAARAAQGQAATAQAAHEKTLSDARARAQSTAQEALRATAAAGDEKRKALEAELAAKLAAADAQIATSKAAAMANVDSIATEAAGLLITQLTGRTADPAAIQAALAAAKS